MSLILELVERASEVSKDRMPQGLADEHLPTTNMRAGSWAVLSYALLSGEMKERFELNGLQQEWGSTVTTSDSG